MRMLSILFSPVLLLAATLGCLTGCGKKEANEVPPPASPKEAATQLHQVFVSAPPEVKQAAEVATEALRSANYEQAVQSLTTMKAKQNLTFEQGMAVHNSMVALEARLVNAAAAGDANAKRAYEQLRASRRN